MAHDARIINRDCVVGMRELPADYIDLTITSPPYDALREYDGHAGAFQFEPTARELFRITKPGGAVVWVVGDQIKDGDESGASFEQALFFKKCGFKLFDTMIYAKAAWRAVGDSRAYWQAFEYMFVLSKGRLATSNPIKDRRNITAGVHKKPTHRLADGTYTGKREVVVSEWGKRTNIWTYQVGGGSCIDSIAHQHPAIFPEALVRDHIRSWSNEGDMIFDPFTGSGTTAVMAIDMGRRFVGFEINEDYCEIARTRLERHVVQETLFR